MKLPLSSPRVDLANAMAAVLQVLKDAPSMSIAGISKATGIDRRTVAKAINLILKVQKTLANQRMEKEKVDGGNEEGRPVVRMREARR
ncbi:MAG: hypothetical protein ACFFCP_13240, partial [Promethearchaeota archaeon]